MPFLYRITRTNLLYIIIDCFIIAISYASSYFFTFYPSIKLHLNLLDYNHLLLLLLSFIGSYYIFRVYLVIWGYSNIRDVYRLALSNIVGLALFILLTHLFSLELNRIIYTLSFLLSSVTVIFYRLVIRDYYSRTRLEKMDTGSHILEKDFAQDRKIIIVGAGEAGRMILAEYYKMNLGKSIVGFVDDDPNKIGKIFNGKMILAPTRGINDIINKYDIDSVDIAMPSVDFNDVEQIVSRIRRENPNIQIRTLPAFTRIFDNKPLIYDLRDIGIEDLIGREELKVDSKVIEEKFTGKTILITGAGGSIGAEICKQILRFKVKKIIAIGRGEFSVYDLIKRLNKYVELLDYTPEIIYRIADVKDFEIMDRIFNEHKIDMVFHAAAHKHVDLMENNEVEAIQNNVFGTKNLLDLCEKHSTHKFVFISTDKAVNPVSIMGATKRLAELLILYYYQQKGVKSAIVRFGNVIGSRGSVIPLFCEQIENGGPVTLTHPEMKRFFMSITEASLLVINAAAYSNGGETFVLDMGEQYRIADIAKKLIRLYGYEPGNEIPIKFMGLRPGEKLNEELSYENEQLKKTGNERIFAINSDTLNYNKDALEGFIMQKKGDISAYDSNKIRMLIKAIIPEYNIISSN